MITVNYCAYCGAATVGELDEFGRCKSCVVWERLQGWERGDSGDRFNVGDDDPLDDDEPEEASR